MLKSPHALGSSQGIQQARRGLAAAHRSRDVACKNCTEYRARTQQARNELASSEATLVYLLHDGLLQPLDFLLALCLELAPHLLNGRLAVCIGDVLVVPPQGIQPLAQLMDQVVIVVRSAAGLSDVGVFLCCGEWHGDPPFLARNWPS